MSEAKILESWKIVLSGTAYTAPELKTFHVQGLASWIPEDLPRHLTSTALVREEEGGSVLVTHSGSRYRLGRPETEGTKTFSQWREEFPDGNG